MAKGLAKIITVGVLIIMSLELFAGCGGNKPTEEAQSGAYFTIGNGGEYAVILDDKISLYWDSNNNRFDVFQFSLDGNSYVGESIRSTISFKVLSDNLTITLKSPNIGFNGSKKIKFKRDNAIGISEEEPIQLDTPNVSPSRHSVLDTYTNLDWTFEAGYQSSLFLRQNGILGAGVEIKRPGSIDFVAEIIQDYIPEPFCLFGIVLKDLKLSQGFYVLRIKHIGGPFMDSDNKIRLSTDSNVVCLNLTVDAEGTVIAIEI